jgi:hypothetical protein
MKFLLELKVHIKKMVQQMLELLDGYAIAVEKVSSNEQKYERQEQGKSLTVVKM